MNFQSIISSYLILFCIQNAFTQDRPREFFYKKIVSESIKWTQIHTRIFFDSWQFVNLVEIDLDQDLECSIAFTEDRLPTSELATKSNAILAVNAGFFDMKSGGSVSYLKVDGEVTDSIPGTGRMIDQAAFVVTPGGDASINWSQTVMFYSDDRFYDDVLLSGPMLIRDGLMVEQDTSKSFVTKRHPRTCACLDMENDLWLITVDGRSDQAVGMSLPELQQYLKALNCVQAINLDGGGSTTMWIKERGVVNHPSDNKKFDAAGEHPVSNIIFIKEKTK